MTAQNYHEQLAEKVDRLASIISPVFDGNLDVFESPPTHYRMRCEFRVWHEGDETFHIMFDPKSKEKYRVDKFDIASTLINNAMDEVMKQVKADPVLRHKLYQIDYLTTLSNQLLVSLIYKKQIEDDWIEHAKQLKTHLEKLAPTHLIGRARKQKICLDQDFIIENFDIHSTEYYFKQIENSFTQPNAHINIKMIEWIITHCKNISGDLCELYCGAGNFTIPLSPYFDRILGTEISKTSVAAAQYNIEKNQVNNVKIAKLSSEEFTQAFLGERDFNRLKDINLEEYNFKTVLVDPPRAGLDDATLKLVAKFDNILYISCNPETLIENLQILNKTHKISQAALFDQFPFTHHIESGVVLQKR